MNICGTSDNHIVLLHWLLGLFTTWEHNTKELSKHFTVFEVELPDYKDSPRGYDLDDYASAVVAMFPMYGIRRPTIVGNSTGGLIAARLAATRPDLVSRLVLIASSGLFDETEDFDKLIVRSATAANVDKIMRHIFFDQAFIPQSTIDAAQMQAEVANVIPIAQPGQAGIIQAGDTQKLADSKTAVTCCESRWLQMSPKISCAPCAGFHS
jgi:pimeloyl-ACP methyl ester carboxylesterase